MNEKEREEAKYEATFEMEGINLNEFEECYLKPLERKLTESLDISTYLFLESKLKEILEKIDTKCRKHVEWNKKKRMDLWR